MNGPWNIAAAVYAVAAPGLKVVLAVVLPAMVQAASMESLLMPGEVIEGHADLESECTQCHKPFSKSAQDTLCLDCHDKVAADMKSQQGFHGRAKAVVQWSCKNCHTDHKGRGANIVPLDHETFDHELTDFMLIGGHATAACARCHDSDAAYRDAPHRCIDCHRENDPHKGRLSEACDHCHDETAWREFRFDHGKTEFALKGEHRKLACNSCHPNQRYEDTPAACYVCHASDDVHHGNFGRQCASCHSERSWSTSAFDHDRDTDFLLQGAHGRTECNQCHREDPFQEDLATDCYSCHAPDDDHKGRFGRQCGECHGPSDWLRITFDHGRDTDYPLRGGHEDVKCTVCHRGNLWDDRLQTVCHGCHRTDDAHAGQLGERCGTCHNERGWRREVLFDHDLTRFALIGLHRITPCEECHIASTYQGTAKTCWRCHEKDDSHRRTLGIHCEQCHTPNGWTLWAFDHNERTDFALDGAHEGLACNACHTESADDTVRLANDCHACHDADDVHRGQFGSRCEQCHETQSFRHLRARR